MVARGKGLVKRKIRPERIKDRLGYSCARVIDLKIKNLRPLLPGQLEPKVSTDLSVYWDFGQRHVYATFCTARLD
jgi:hypothetical protein